MRFIRQYKVTHSVILRVLFFQLLFTSYTVFSADTSEMAIANQIITLIKSGAHKSAFALAREQAPEYEGLVKFDYAYGVAAQKVGHFHEAIFAFERVLKRHPDQLGTRYALAVSYFSVGNIIAAENEFILLQSLDDDSEFIHIPQYLAKIKQQKSVPFGVWGHSAQLGFGIDSNANSGTDAESIGSYVIDESSQELNDQYVSTLWQTSFIKPINKVSSWYAVGRVKYHAFIQNSEMSRAFVDVISGYRLKRHKVNYHLSLYTRPMWLDGDKYVDYSGISFDARHQFEQNFELGGSINAALLRFENDQLDKNQQILSLWYKQKFWDLDHKVTFTIGNESGVNTDDRDLGRTFNGISYQTFFDFTPNDKITVKVDYVSSVYDDLTIYSNEERSDGLLKLNADYQKSFDRHWSWLIKLSLMDNDSSNAPLHEVFSYNRAILWNAIQYKF